MKYTYIIHFRYTRQSSHVKQNALKLLIIWFFLLSPFFLNQQIHSANTIHESYCASNVTHWVARRITFFKVYLFMLTEHMVGGAKRERERENPKQAPHSTQSLRWGSIPQPQDHNLSWYWESSVGSLTDWATQVPPLFFSLINTCNLVDLVCPQTTVWIIKAEAGVLSVSDTFLKSMVFFLLETESTRLFQWWLQCSCIFYASAITGKWFCFVDFRSCS